MGFHVSLGECIIPAEKLNWGACDFGDASAVRGFRV